MALGQGGRRSHPLSLNEGPAMPGSHPSSEPHEAHTASKQRARDQGSGRRVRLRKGATLCFHQFGSCVSLRKFIPSLSLTWKRGFRWLPPDKCVWELSGSGDGGGEHMTSRQVGQTPSSAFPVQALTVSSVQPLTRHCHPFLFTTRRRGYL